MPTLVDLFDRCNSVAHITRSGVLLGRFDNVDQMMRNAAPFGERDLVGANVESAIDSGGVAADDFAAVPQGELDAQRALARRCGSQDGQYGRPQTSS
jgi:hypothetical protein